MKIDTQKQSISRSHQRSCARCWADHSPRFLKNFVPGEGTICPRCAYSLGVRVQDCKLFLLAAYAPDDGLMWSQPDVVTERWLTGLIVADPKLGPRFLSEIIEAAERRAAAIKGGVA